MTDTSGRLFEMPWAVWDHDSSSWRTYAGTSHSGSRRFSGTWPTSGSMRDGACYEHPTWAHPTSAPASSSAPLLNTLVDQLLPTPTSRDHKDGTFCENVDENALLGRVAWRFLPTPRAQNGGPRNSKPWLRPLDEPQNLENAVARIPGVLSAPPSNDGNTSTDPHQPQLPTGD